MRSAKSVPRAFMAAFSSSVSWGSLSGSVMSSSLSTRRRIETSRASSARSSRSLLLPSLIKPSLHSDVGVAAPLKLSNYLLPRVAPVVLHVGHTFRDARNGADRVRKRPVDVPLAEFLEVVDETLGDDT